MDELLKDFGKHYNFLYENASNDAIAVIEVSLCEAYDEAVNRDASFLDLVKRFSKARQDFLTSDREISAFMLAVQTVQRREMFRKAGLTV